MAGGCCSGDRPQAVGTAAEDTRESVRDRYATLATAQGSCCGGGDELAAYVEALYAPEELAVLPQEVRDMAMGCGNPTALTNLRPGMVVVDLGSGGGIDAILAALKVGPEGHVIGVDMTPEMIARARENATKAGLANVEFRQGEIEALPIEDGVADVIISNCVINLSPEKARVFAEAYRVLRLGGLLAVSDMVTLRPLPTFVRDDPAAWSSCVAGAIDKDEYLRLIAEAGFLMPTVKDLSVYSSEQVAAFKEVSPDLFGAAGSLDAEELAAVDGCLASARIVALKAESSCC